MSVVCRHKEGDKDVYYTYAKGSPEIMLNIMNVKTVP
jgi:magnesium-transporting ATPase (P-type)